MTGENHYDVTQHPEGDARADIGAVINSIIADIKRRQAHRDIDEGGKPGAVIYIPPGDYHLKTQVLINVSYLKIMGAGHGLTCRQAPTMPPAPRFSSNATATPVSARLNSRIFASTGCTSLMTDQAMTTRKTPISTARPGSMWPAPMTPSASPGWG